MGWSLGYLPPKETELLDKFFLAAGKCLYVASEFEGKCHGILLTIRLAHHLEETGNLQASIELVSTLKRKMLGGALNELKEIPDFGADELGLLERAKDARNFIAHEGASLGHLGYASSKQIKSKLTSLRHEVEALVAGDNIVSRWIYEIEERRSAPRQIQDLYPRWIERWIFGELDEMEPGWLIR